jgi:sugar phosphate isomerase/epimerase
VIATRHGDREEPATTRRFGLAALTVLELAPPDMVSCAAATGYDAVGIRLIPSTPTEPKHDTIGDTALIRETKKRSDDLGVPVQDIETLRLNPDTDVRRDYEEFLATGAQLGASTIVVAGMDPDRQRLTDNFQELAELAQTFGLTPNLEFMPWTGVPSLSVAAEVLKAVDHPNVGLLIDSIHFDRSGSDPADLDRLPPSWFTYIQLCDAVAERPTTTEGLIHQARRQREIPGRGALDVLAPLRHLSGDLLLALEVPLTAPSPLPPERRAAEILESTRALVGRLE